MTRLFCFSSQKLEQGEVQVVSILHIRVALGPFHQGGRMHMVAQSVLKMNEIIKRIGSRLGKNIQSIGGIGRGVLNHLGVFLFMLGKHLCHGHQSFKRALEEENAHMKLPASDKTGTICRRLTLVLAMF